MSHLKEMLRAADPVARESWPADADMAGRRARLGAAAVPGPARSSVSDQQHRARPLWRAVPAAAALAVALWAVRSFGPSIAPTAAAAVRFEVRLAETIPAAGLREAPVGTQPVLVYLHEDTVVTNDHILRSQVVPAGGRYGIAVELSPDGAARLRAATRQHLGRPVALMLDGLVLMAPVVRSEIAQVGILSGDFSREDAERLARGMTGR